MHSSEDDVEGDGEVWTITEEQRDYYTAQFRSLQPDPNGLIAGPAARLFFEKSRLPVQELRKICSLKWTKFVDSPTSSVSSPGPKPVNFDFHKSAVEQVCLLYVFVLKQDPKILHPVPLRVTPESQGIPPGEEEPCRSPRKLTEPQQIPYEQLGAEGGSPKKSTTTLDNNATSSSDIRPIQRPQPKKPAAPGPGAIPPPPQPATLTTPDEAPGVVPLSTGGTSGPTSLPVTVVTAQMGPKKEPPPPPPPRPYRTHGRSSSLDLNRLEFVLLNLILPTTSPKKLIGQRSEGDVLALVGDQAGFADFAQFVQEEESCVDAGQPRRHGAFEVYRKPATRSGVPDVGVGMRDLDSPTEDPQQHRLRSERSDQNSLRRLQEQNSLLVRVCQELNQELAEVQEERALLELQMEQFRAQMAE
ncbi:hypothetical protein C0J52_01727 [Blattella germanica]|nr:hypothetical protein C0J52_01727 [Blattella germanica]